jgi:phosphate starvation-inducible PhoH-like protein
MTHQNKRLSKREKRLLRQQQPEKDTTPNLGLNLRRIVPLTDNQRVAFEGYEDDNNLMLHGIAGTGKSFLEVYFALREILSGISAKKKLVIVRSVVPTRDMGFLPGNAAEKAAVYEAPYSSICTELFGRGDAYETLKRHGIVQFISTSFVRGVTLNDSIVLVDEMQNMSLHELDSVMTRIGKNTRIMFAGDFRQSDFTKEQERAGLKDFMRIINRMKSFCFVDFQKEDIVRSALVKEYIIQKDELRVVI